MLRKRRNVGVATSTDFLHWTKYSGNPVITDNVAIPGDHLDRQYGLYYLGFYSDWPWVRGGYAIQTLPSDCFSGNTRLNDPYVVLNPQGFYEMTFTVENQSVPSPYTGGRPLAMRFAGRN
jgi:hypothetical protein